MVGTLFPQLCLSRQGSQAAQERGQAGHCVPGADVLAGEQAPGEPLVCGGSVSLASSRSYQGPVGAPQMLYCGSWEGYTQWGQQVLLLRLFRTQGS